MNVHFHSSFARLTMSKKLRKQFFVDPTVQGAIVRRLMIHWLVVFAVLFVFLVVMQVLVGGPFKPLSHHINTIGERYGLLLACLTCLLPVFAYDAIKLSHRFAGPMVSFRQALHQVANGENIDPIHFRKNDFWKPLTDDLNRIAAELKGRRDADGSSPAEGCSEVEVSTTV
jgi:hypothetical protein